LVFAERMLRESCTLKEMTFELKIFLPVPAGILISLPTSSPHARATILSQAWIMEVWLRVAEDYSIFDIDVTTELPAE